MRLTCIGDLHGRSNWKEIVEQNKGSHYIFMGDYIDPYLIEKISEDEAIDNLKELLAFKEENLDNVTLLIGNHDAQYLYYPTFGRTKAMSFKNIVNINEIYQDNFNLFQWAFQKDKYLMTHAGVSNAWFDEYCLYFYEFGLKSDFSNFADTLNKIGRNRKYVGIFDTVSYFRGGGDLHGSLIWADTRELVRDHLIYFHQVCGHNKHLDFRKVGDHESSITFIDCLFNRTKGLTLSL